MCSSDLSHWEKILQQMNAEEKQSPYGQNIAEAVREAQAQGAFDNLPGAGAPLHLDDDAMVPEELRAAYRILKNAGFIPPELDAHSEVRSIEQLLKAAEDDGERRRLVARIHYLLGRGALRGERRSAVTASAPVTARFPVAVAPKGIRPRRLQ